jgi:hypothetical protein
MIDDMSRCAAHGRPSRSRRASLLAAGFALLSACSSSVETPRADAPTSDSAASTTVAAVSTTSSTDVPSTSTTMTSTTTTSTTSTTITSTSTTSTTTTMPSAPTDEPVVVYAGTPESAAWQRLGLWNGTEWVDLEDDAAFDDPSTIDRASVTGVDLPGVSTDVPFTLSDYACVDSFLHVGIDPDIVLPPSPLGWGYGGLAVRADWPLQPRPVTAVGIEADVYQDVGERLLEGRADIDPSDGDVVQVLRADLDGDGTEEVLVSFRYLSAPDFGEVGDFSIVYIRHIVAGSVDDRIVYEYLVPFSPDFPSPGRGSVAAVADLNGDGVMEVAIGGSYWETQVIEVYEWRDGSLERVLGGACGV